MSTTKITTLQVDKSNFSKTQTIHQALPSASALSNNQVLLEIEKFGFTANNITYAVIGHKVGYWNFFPVDATWGIIPVWGIGKVVHSKHPAIETGKRYYGYFPMASHVVVEAGRVNPYGFTDVVAHRNPLPPIYNNYMDVKAAFGTSDEDVQMIFRPLFTTSFLLDDFLADNNFFKAEHIVLTSASSKTGMGLAFLLQNRKDKAYKVIGLTSKSNLDFVKGLGYYDDVLTYEEKAQLPQASTCIVDFSGNTALLYNLQEQLQDHLKHNCMVGLSHWDKYGKATTMPKGEFFFAPTYAQERVKEWSPEGFQTRLKKAWNQFNSANANTLQIQAVQGEQAIQNNYLEMLEGKVIPKSGVIMQF